MVDFEESDPWSRPCFTEDLVNRAKSSQDSFQSYGRIQGIRRCPRNLLMVNFEIVVKRVVCKAEMVQKTLLQIFLSKTIALKSQRLCSKSTESLGQRLWSRTAKAFNTVKMKAKPVLISFVFTVKSRWALTADMVAKDQNGTKDIIAFLDHTGIITLEPSKRLVLSSKANKEPFKLYKKTICSYLIAKTNWHLYNNQVIMKVLVQYSYDEAVVFSILYTKMNWKRISQSKVDEYSLPLSSNEARVLTKYLVSTQMSTITHIGLCIGNIANVCAKNKYLYDEAFVQANKLSLTKGVFHLTEAHFTDGISQLKALSIINILARIGIDLLAQKSGLDNNCHKIICCFILRNEPRIMTQISKTVWIRVSISAFVGQCLLIVTISSYVAYQRFFLSGSFISFECIHEKFDNHFEYSKSSLGITKADSTTSFITLKNRSLKVVVGRPIFQQQRLQLCQ